MARCFWARVLLLSLPIADAVLPRQRREATLRSEGASQAHLWKAHDAVKPAAPPGSAAVANVYIIRHGQSGTNAFLERLIRRGRRTPAGGLFDPSLTGKGLRQAALAQGVVGGRLGLQSVPVEKVRLATSLNRRAFDTLVIATTPLWQKWAAAGSPFLVQAVPALMECGPSWVPQRRKGVALDDPMRWEDSMLSKNVSDIVGVDAGAARSLFYQTAEDRSQSTTRKSVEVRATYSKGVEGVTCGAGHVAQYGRFLVDTARAGKEHIFIGSHSITTRFVSGALGADPSKSVPIDGQRGFFSPARQLLPNAAVLHCHLRVSADGRPTLEPQRLYPNPIFSL